MVVVLVVVLVVAVVASSASWLSMLDSVSVKLIECAEVGRNVGDEIS